jgi:hypothetical protein
MLKKTRDVFLLSLFSRICIVESTLMILAGAMKALQTPGLSKTEITRLRSLVQASSLYQVKIAEYIDYRGTEKELVEMGRKYRELAQREHARYKPVEAKQEPHH